MKNICVFCGSSFGKEKIYEEKAIELAEILVKNNMRMIYGGAKVGLMTKIADRMMELGGEVIGIMPKLLIEKEVSHTGITKLIEVNSMHERKSLMQDMSDAFITMPGGFGTLDEFFEMLTSAQLDIHHKPSAILNINSYYDHLEKFLENMANQGFIEKEHKKMIIFESEPENLIYKLRNYVHPKVDKAEIALGKNKLSK